MTDLSLVPIDDLVAEIGSRVDTSIFAYTRYVDGGDPIIDYAYKGEFLTSIGLCDWVKSGIIADKYEEVED